MRARLLLSVLVALLALAVPAQALATSPPRIGHVFVVFLENENADVTFAPGSPAPYLSQTLPAKGAFIPDYYGVTHLSLGNYVGFVSGQGSNVQTQADCQLFTDFIGPGLFDVNGQALGQGCVYPPYVKTIANQLEERGLKWKGYMEDMGNDPSRESGLCGHPPVNGRDNTQTAAADDQYAARHNPFIYFHSIIDDNYNCELHDVPLSQLPGDLTTTSKTPNFSFITPDLCNDGHDADCADGGPGGLAGRRRLAAHLGPADHELVGVQARRPAARDLRRGRGRGRHRGRQRVLQPGAVPQHAEQRRPHPGNGRRTRGSSRTVAIHQGRHGHEPSLQPLLGAAHDRAAVQPVVSRVRRNAGPGQLRRRRLHAAPLR